MAVKKKSAKATPSRGTTRTTKTLIKTMLILCLQVRHANPVNFAWTSVSAIRVNRLSKVCGLWRSQIMFVADCFLIIVLTIGCC